MAVEQRARRAAGCRRWCRRPATGVMLSVAPGTGRCRCSTWPPAARRATAPARATARTASDSPSRRSGPAAPTRRPVGRGRPAPVHAGRRGRRRPSCRSSRLPVHAESLTCPSSDLGKPETRWSTQSARPPPPPAKTSRRIRSSSRRRVAPAVLVGGGDPERPVRGGGHRAQPAVRLVSSSRGWPSTVPGVGQLHQPEPLAAQAAGDQQPVRLAASPEQDASSVAPLHDRVGEPLVAGLCPRPPASRSCRPW